MNPYYVCENCRCHVKRADPTCPFCGTASRRAMAPFSSSLARSARLSRAQWLAYGAAVAAFACTGRATMMGDGSEQQPAAPLGDGGFPCIGPNGPLSLDCQRASEWCYTNHGFDPTECVPLTTTCAPDDPSDACSSVVTWDAAACDGGIPSCACLTVTCGSGFCLEDEAGGVTVSCGSCYGAPPARPTRTASSRHRLRISWPPRSPSRNR